MHKPPKSKITAPLWSLLLPVVATALLLIIASQQPDGRLHLWVLDAGQVGQIGQGHSIFLKTPKGHTVLIDGGSGSTPVLNGIGQHTPFWQRDLDLLVLTQPSQSRMMGLPDVLARYRIGEVVQTQFTPTLAVQGQWQHALQERDAAVHHPKRGDTFTFEDEPELSLRVISRHEEGKGDSPIVLKLTYHNHGVLLLGQADLQTQLDILSYQKSYLPSQILIMSQPTKDSTPAPDFFAAIRPAAVVVSTNNPEAGGRGLGVGGQGSNNKANPQSLTPNPQSPMFNTALNGTVEIIVEEQGVRVRMER